MGTCTSSSIDITERRPRSENTMRMNITAWFLQIVINQFRVQAKRDNKSGASLDGGTTITSKLLAFN